MTANPRLLSYCPIVRVDLEQVVTIERACFGGYWSRHVFEEEILQPQQRLWCLKFEETVLGYSGMWRVLEEAHLTTLAVHPEWRGYNLGELLLWLVLARCLKEEAQWLTLEVRASNKIALELYQKYGLVQIGQRKRYYPDDEDAFVLWRPDLQQYRFRKILYQKGLELFKTLEEHRLALVGWEPLP